MYSTVIIDFTLCLDFYFVKFDIQDIIEGVSCLFLNDFGLNQFSSPGDHHWIQYTEASLFISAIRSYWAVSDL